jgi:ABC-type sugar transport system ATPase subunit
MSRAASVSLQHLTKEYPGGVNAVRDVSLDIAEGEFLVLVGPSGCGKSTILRMIAGLETPSSGSVLIGDRLCNRVEPKDRDIAMVFQNYALYPHMTVRENLEFGLKLANVPRHEIDARIREAAEILEIGSLLDRKPRLLSGGQRQRVALGRAIVRKPRVFLFDEPLSNLDAKMRIQMRVELGRLHSRLQTTMIYVTHDQTEAMTMGDRIVCMRDGTIHQMGKPMDLYNNPVNEYVASFIGMPPMNFIAAEVSDGVLLLAESKLRIPIPDRLVKPLEGRRFVKLGIRPEHIEVCSWGDTVLPALVEVVEPLGSETLVYASCESLSLVFRVPPSSRHETGERLFIGFSEEHLHAFAESGERIS